MAISFEGAYSLFSYSFSFNMHRKPLWIVLNHIWQSDLMANFTLLISFLGMLFMLYTLLRIHMILVAYTWPTPSPFSWPEPQFLHNSGFLTPFHPNGYMHTLNSQNHTSKSNPLFGCLFACKQYTPINFCKLLPNAEIKQKLKEYKTIPLSSCHGSNIWYQQSSNYCLKPSNKCILNLEVIKIQLEKCDHFLN